MLVKKDSPVYVHKKLKKEIKISYTHRDRREEGDHGSSLSAGDSTCTLQFASDGYREFITIAASMQNLDQGQAMQIINPFYGKFCAI
jgi:hypothetical protein